MIRLDRYIHERTKESRDKIKFLIKKGAVTVDYDIVKDPARKLRGDEEVRIYEELLPESRFVYYLLYKPSGVVTARSDEKDMTVMDLLFEGEDTDLSPVGRLDKDTEGVLIITNDGELNHRLTSPKYHVKKKYYVECDKPFPDNVKEILESPMEFQDFTTLGSEFEKLTENTGYLTITEGKYHQVKRMFRRLNLEVTYLRRDSFGPLTLKGLEKGSSRSLTEEEIRLLKERS